MANEKLTWNDLRKAVALMSGASEQECGIFLNALLDTITKGLKEDKVVRIKGIGTFTLKSVAPRKSVNIATGESFVIDGYNKLTFNAEASLKESVEKRIDTPSTEEMLGDLTNDPIRKLGQQADEIVDILADLGQSPKETSGTTNEEEEHIEPMQDDATEQDSIDEKEVTQVEQSTAGDEETEEKADDTTEEVEEVKSEPAEELSSATVAAAPQSADTDEKEEETTNEPITTRIEQAMNTTEQTTTGQELQPNQNNKAKKWSIAGWIVALILLCVLCGFFYYFRVPIAHWWACLKECQPTETEVVAAVPETIVEEPSDTIVPLAQQPREYTEFIGEETVSFGSRLTWIAKKYYGDKDLWVFIYEANQSSIKSPNYLQYGQKIMVPKLDEQLKDLSNPETRQLVDELTAEYLQQQQ